MKSKILLAKNPSFCEACGYLETFRDFVELEPQGQAVFFDRTECVKHRGYCQLHDRWFDREQEVVTVKVTDVVTGRKFERREIV